MGGVEVYIPGVVAIHEGIQGEPWGELPDGTWVLLEKKQWLEYRVKELERKITKMEAGSETQKGARS